MKKIAIALCSFVLVLMIGMPFIFEATQDISTVKAEETQTQVYDAEFFSRANTYNATLTQTAVPGSTMLTSHITYGKI